MESGVLQIPKWATLCRQAERLVIGDFMLNEAQILAISALARPNGRIFNADPSTQKSFRAGPCMSNKQTRSCVRLS